MCWKTSGLRMISFGFSSVRATNVLAPRRIPFYGVGCGHRRVAAPEHEIRIDETRINRSSFHVPNPGVGWWRNVFAERGDETVAHDERATLDHFARFRNDLSADQRVHPEW